MRKITNRLLSMLKFLVLSAIGSLLVAAGVALWHILETPQPLESALPGKDRIYRWKHGYISYKVLGAEQAPPLVLFHTLGIGTSAYEMRELIEPLAKQYRVYAPDLPGFGLSDHPHIDYSAETYLAFFKDFLAEVVAQPATIVASELSGSYAVAVAGRIPELCKRLVLLSPTAFFVPKRKQNWLSQLIELPLISFFLYSLLSTRAALRYNLSRQYAPAREHVPSSTIDHLHAASHQLGAHYASIALLGGKLALDASEALALSRQPTLIIWGAHAFDNVRSLVDQQPGPDSVRMILIEDTGVPVHEQRAATVIAAIREWAATEEDALDLPTATADISSSVFAAPTVNTLPEPVPVSDVSNVEALASKETIMPSKKPANKPQQTASASKPAPAPAAPPAPVIEAYCVKCKTKRTMNNAHQVTLKNGRPAMEGVCPVCATKLFRIGAAPAAH